MSDKSCKIVELSQFGENSYAEVDLCSSYTSSEECAGSYTNAIALSQPKVGPFQSGDIQIEQSSNVHLGQKILYEKCNIRVVNYINDVTETPAIIKDTSVSGNKPSEFQKSNTDIENKYKLGIRKDVRQVIIIFGVIILLIIASVLLAIFLSAILSPATESESPSSTTMRNPPALIFTTEPKKDKCPESAVVLPMPDLVFDPTKEQMMFYYENKFVARKEWNASEYQYERIKLETPVKYVIVSHTLQHPCLKFQNCAERVRSLQKFDRNVRKLDDIRYNFLIGGTGDIFEGRGWDSVGQHTDNYNNRSLGIAFIMDSNEFSYTHSQITAFQLLLLIGEGKKKISKDYILFGRCQVVLTTDSPGRRLYVFIKRLDHWSPNWPSNLK